MVLTASPASPLLTSWRFAPADLRPGQRGLLIGVVVAVHVLVASLVLMVAPIHQVISEPEAIQVELIREEPMRSPSPPPSPAPPRPSAKPIPLPVAAPKPTPPAPAVLATPAAQPARVQVPAPLPEARPTTPTEPAAAAPANPTATAPPTPIPVAEPARPSPQPKVLPSSAVRYLVQPVLSYPRVSRDLGEAGVVRLKVLVDEQGRPKDIEINKSSGYPRLDQQAVSAMRAARFQPHLDDGVPRPVWVVAPLTFNLDE